MTYRITNEIKQEANKLGVNIKPSNIKNKKLDVFNKDGKKIASIGDAKYKDYHIYKREKGIEYANERRRLYHLRHKGEPMKKNGKYTASYLAKTLLW